jgi:hypothetical protein
MLSVLLILTIAFANVSIAAVTVQAQDNDVVSTSTVQVKDADLNKADVLELMSANDAQFDNVRVEYERVSYPGPTRPIDYSRYRTGGRAKPPPYVVKADPDVDKSGIPDAQTLLKLQDTYLRAPPGETPPMPPDDVKKWVELIHSGKISVSIYQPPPKEPFRFRAILGLRWPDVAVERGDNVDPHLTGKSYSKWRSIGQETGFLDNLPMGEGKRDWIVNTVNNPFEFNIYQEIALLQEFALGVGYAKYIVDVSELRRNNERILMRARMQIWPELVSDAELELDDFLIVRKATFNSKTTTISLDSDGEFVAGDQFHCAKRGRLERVYTATGRFGEKFDIELLSLQFNISDEEFNRLADFSTPKSDRRFEHDVTQAASSK